MSFRNVLGGDVQDVVEQVDVLLDGDDALIVLFDGRRMGATSTGSARPRANWSW